MAQNEDSLGVYVHLPWCVTKCPYCDFNSYASTEFPEQRYTDSLLSELAWSAEQVQWRGRKATSVFFGGGTPSLFGADSLAAVLDAIDQHLGLADDCEVTAEANPGTLEGAAVEKLSAMRAAGINRISFGVQSFDDRLLDTLGRVHSGAEALVALRAAHEAGFERISCDLIFAVPGQTLDGWQRDIEQALSLGILDHLSTYGLTFEPGTAMTGMLKAGMIERADEELELAMYRAIRSATADAGLQHYEISNFARPGCESRHNLGYWRRHDWLGLGAGAHGFTSRSPGAPWGERWANIRLPEIWMSAGNGHRRHFEETLDRGQALAETLLMGLRVSEGIAVADIEQRFSMDADQAMPRLARLVDDGLMLRESGRVSLSPSGLELADSVIAELAG